MCLKYLVYLLIIHHFEISYFEGAQLLLYVYDSQYSFQNNLFAIDYHRDSESCTQILYAKDLCDLNAKLPMTIL